MVVGTIVGTGIYSSIAVLIFLKCGAERHVAWTIPLIVFFLIIYLYWADGKIKLVETGFSKDENRKLLRKVFSKLDWPIREYAHHIELQNDRFILKLIHPTIIYSENYIAYNFQYTENSKSGRPVFFIGIRTYLRKKFRNELHKQLTVGI